MRLVNRKAVYLMAVLLGYCFICGCEEYARQPSDKKELAEVIELGSTIGSVAEILSPESVPVVGFGLVGGLNGTGSSECPPEIRAYLTRYILTQVPGQHIAIDALINSPNTAVVRLEGAMPITALKDQYFDIRATALPGTRTTSLQGGWLYSAELRAVGNSAIVTKVLAMAEGPVYIDAIDTAETVNNRVGFILGGGRILNEFKISVLLLEDDYAMMGLVRNRLNERFNDAQAKAFSPSRLELSVPPEYKQRRQRFIKIIKTIYLEQTPELTQQRIRTLVGKLAVSDNKEISEIALEAIGNECVSKLSTLLNSSNEEVRFRSARCMANFGSNLGLRALVEIAVNRESAYRIDALETIALSAGSKTTTLLARRLLRDSDFEVKNAAYEQLRKMDSAIITESIIARNFYLEQIPQTGYKEIYVSRSGLPKIVLFDAPIYCSDDIFVQSSDGNIIINSRPGQKYVSVIRKDPASPTEIFRLKSSFDLSDIIRTLCEEPAKKGEQSRGGLGVTYADAIAVLKQMCDKGAIRARFHAGPLPKFD